MNLISLPNGRIVNLDHLTYAERTGDYVTLHLSSSGDSGSIVRLKEGEGARRVWAYVIDKCAAKIETHRL
jgi:hypothetical protein